MKILNILRENQHAGGETGPARRVAAVRADDFDRALEQVVGSGAHPSEAYNNRGAARHARGDLDGALADFDRALALNPRYPEAYNNRGAARHARGDLDGALADFDRALALVPRRDAATIYHNRGAARRGDFDGAIADFSRALEIDPALCTGYLSRANARFHKRDRGCREDYRAAFRLDPRLAAREIIRLLADGLRHDLPGVLTNCGKHLRIDPDDLVAYARRGLTLLLAGRDADAGRDIRAVLLRDPGWEQPLRLLVQEALRQRAGSRTEGPGGRGGTDARSATDPCGSDRGAPAAVSGS
jgi:tetratricopeptide (TPR) repeat protein